MKKKNPRTYQITTLTYLFRGFKSLELIILFSNQWYEALLRRYLREKINLGYTLLCPMRSMFQQAEIRLL